MKTPDSLQATSGAEEAEQLFLFEQPPFSPIYPPKRSLPGKALSVLLQDRTLTHLEFLALTGSWRLSEPIRALRHDYGWPVEAFDVHSPTPDNPDRSIARYYLPKRVLREVGLRD
jgi:hypothetical protein